ncbi:MAG: hypothetical protein ACREBR_00690, partial [bacterium]
CGVILQIRDTYHNKSKDTQVKVVLECYRHRQYSKPNDNFTKISNGNDRVAKSVVRQTLRDNKTASRGIKGKSMPRKSKSRRPMKREETCPFWFAIVCSVNDQCWYLQYQQSEITHPYSGCLVSRRTHAGHAFVPGKFLANTVGNIDEENRKLAIELLGGEGGMGSMTAQQVAMFLSKRTGLTFTKEQVTYLCHKSAKLADGLSCKPSSADALIEYLSSRCVFFFFH